MLQELQSDGDAIAFAVPADAAHGEVTLSPVLDVRAAKPLHGELVALRGDTVIVDGSQVERIGAQCAAILLSAARSWEADAQEFSLVNPSDALRRGLELLGIALGEVGGIAPDFGDAPD